MDPPNAELLQRVYDGDGEAFAAVADQLRPQLLAYVHRRMSDGLKGRVEPQDILQEAILSGTKALPERDDRDWDVFGWLCELCERRIIDTHRRANAQKRAADKQVALDGRQSAQEGALIDVLVASLTSPSEAFSRGQREYELLQAMQQLPPEAQTALRMRYVENRPSKEIAAALGKSDGATRVLLTRSLQKLQQTLGSHSLFQSFQKSPEPDDGAT